MSESTSQLKIGAALDGSFEQTTTTVKRKIGELGTAATSTGKSLAGMGDGTAQSAQKVESATKAMIQSIQRTTAATEAGDKSTRAYQESLARMRGIDVAALKPYLDQLDSAKMKAAQATAANNSLGDSFAGMGSRSLIAANAIGMIGAAVTAAFSAASIKGVIDIADNFSKLAQKSGVAVEALRELNYAASLSDVSTEALGTGLRKLSQNMAAAASGSKEQAAAFAAIGISVKGVDGDLKGADKVLSEVAAKFATFKDGPEKAALAIELFGKAGADMIPLLNSGATGLAEMAKEANDLGVVFSSELAKSAEAFNDNLTRIQASAEGTKIAIANELLPTLNLLAQAFLDAKKESSGFGGFIGGALRTIIEAATILYANVEFVLKGIGREFGAVGAQVVALGKLDIKGFNAISQAVKEDGVRARAELDKFQYDLLNAGILNSKAGAGRGTGVDPRLLGDTQTTAPIVAAEKAAKAAQISDYEKLTKAIAEKTAVAKLDLLTQEKLTEGQKLAAKFETDLLMATLKMTDAEIKSTRARLSGLVSIEQAIITKEKATKRLIAEYAEELDIQKELSAAQVASDTARTNGIQAVTTYADSIKEQNEYSQLELSLMGSSATAREIALGQYKVELDLKKQIEAIDSNAGFDEAERITQRARARAAAAQSMAVIETKVYTDEWKKTADSIQSSLTDALLRGFESGKDFARNLRDTLVNMFKTLVLRPIISAVVNPVAGALTGALGLSGAAQAAGAGSSLLSGASTLATLASSAASWGTAAGAGFMATIGGSTVGGGAAAGILATGGAAGAGTAGMIGALGPYALAALAVLAIAKMTQGETRNGAAYGVGLDGMATKLQGPSGGEIASKEARAMFNITKSSIEGMLTAFGSKAVLTGFTAGLESSDNGKGFAYSTGKINGVSFGDTNTFNNSRGDKSQEQALKDYQKELSQSVLEALQVTADIPGTVAKLIKDGLNGSDVKDLTLEATSAILLTVETLSKQVNTFNSAMMSLPFESLKNLSFDTAAGLIAAAGGFEKLDANLGGFYQNFFSAAEQTAQLTSTTSKSFADLGLVMPTLDEGARAAYRAMVELAAGQDLSIEANAKAYASLLALQDPMNRLAPAFADVGANAAKAAEAIVQAAARMQAAAQNASNVAVQLGLTTAIQVARDTANEAYTAFKTALPQAAGYTEAQIVSFARDKSQIGLLSAADQTTINTFVSAIGAFATAKAADLQTTQTYTAPETYTAPDNSIADAIAQITKGLKDAGVSLGVELLKAQGKTVEAMAAQRAIDTVGYNAAQLALYDYNQALRDQIAAVGEASALQTRINSERKGLQEQYDQLTMTSVQLLAKQRAELNGSNQALFDSINAIKAEASAKELAGKAVAQAREAATKSASDGLSALQRAVEAQRKIVQFSRDAAAASVAEITSVFDLLKSSVKELYGTVDSTAQMQAGQGRAFISQALATAQSTGYLPESKALADAINAAKGGTQEFASQFEKDFAALTLAGDLSLMEALSKNQLTEAQKALKTQEDQLQTLDGVLDIARQQLDAANGINTSVLSVAAALAGYNTSITALIVANGVTRPATTTTTGGGILTPTSAIGGLYQSILGRTGDAGGVAFYESLLSAGTSLADVAAQLAASTEARNRVPGFASGGFHSGGLRLVGENGPELEATGPSRIFNASQTSAMLGGNNARLESLVEGLTQEVQRLQAIVNDGNKNTRRAADAVNGNPEMPMLVQTV